MTIASEHSEDGRPIARHEDDDHQSPREHDTRAELGRQPALPGYDPTVSWSPRGLMPPYICLLCVSAHSAVVVCVYTVYNNRNKIQLTYTTIPNDFACVLNTVYIEYQEMRSSLFFSPQSLLESDAIHCIQPIIYVYIRYSPHISFAKRTLLRQNKTECVYIYLKKLFCFFYLKRNGGFGEGKKDAPISMSVVYIFTFRCTGNRVIRYREMDSVVTYYCLIHIHTHVILVEVVIVLCFVLLCSLFFFPHTYTNGADKRFSSIQA